MGQGVAIESIYVLEDVHAIFSVVLFDSIPCIPSAGLVSMQREEKLSSKMMAPKINKPGAKTLAFFNIILLQA